MRMKELLESVQYLTDPRGQRQAVMLDLEVWQEVLATLRKSETSETTERTPMSPSEREAATMREEVAYQAMHSQLHQTHAGQHVAIYGQKLIDSDVSGAALYKRIRREFPGEFVLITPVEEKAEEVIIVRVPRLILNN